MKLKLLTKKDRRTPLQREIDRLFEQMESCPDQSSDEYERMVSEMERLINLSEKLNPPRKKVDPNVVLSAGTELTGMGLIMGFERMHVIATKAFSRIRRTKV